MLEDLADHLLVGAVVLGHQHMQAAARLRRAAARPRRARPPASPGGRAQRGAQAREQGGVVDVGRQVGQRRQRRPSPAPAPTAIRSIGSTGGRAQQRGQGREVDRRRRGRSPARPAAPSACRSSSAADFGGGDAPRLAAEALHALGERRRGVAPADHDHAARQPLGLRPTGSARSANGSSIQKVEPWPSTLRHADRAAHQLDQLAGDVEPETAAADAAADAVVAAREPLEQVRLRLGATARCRCPRPRSAADTVGRRCAHRLDPDHHPAAVGELDGVADQVDQRLVQLARAAAQPLGRVGRQPQPQRQALGGREMAEQHAAAAAGCRAGRTARPRS